MRKFLTMRRTCSETAFQRRAGPNQFSFGGRIHDHFCKSMMWLPMLVAEASLVIKPRPPLGWKEEVVFIAPWCGSACLHILLWDMGAELAKKVQQAYTSWMFSWQVPVAKKGAYRKLAWEHPAWCTRGSLSLSEGSISSVFWSLN